jgi:hypothetical protein
MKVESSIVAQSRLFNAALAAGLSLGVLIMTFLVVVHERWQLALEAAIFVGVVSIIVRDILVHLAPEVFAQQKISGWLKVCRQMPLIIWVTCLAGTIFGWLGTAVLYAAGMGYTSLPVAALFGFGSLALFVHLLVRAAVAVPEVGGKPPTEN